MPHISPYSFFIDVGRGSRPMVAYSANMTHHEKDGGGQPTFKDAQKDAEETGVFCWNVTTEETAVAMS